MKPNLLDRAIAYVAPKRAAMRLQHRAAFEAFSGLGSDGGALSPSNGRWITTPRSADADTIRALPRQRAESRELRRTNPIATGAIQTNLDRVVGTGLQPIFTPNLRILGWTEEQGAAFAEAAADEFSLWADSRECTLERNQTFYERQELVLGSRLESGDCFTLLPDQPPTETQPYKLRLQLIEADRCDSPNEGETDTVVKGVRFDASGAPVAYYILDAHPGGLKTTAGTRRGRWIDAVGRSGRRRILHHYRPTRPEQTRGVPYLAPVIQAIKDLGRYTEAEITAAVLSAFYTVFIEQDGGSNPAPIWGAEGTDPNAPGAPGPEIAMAPGAVIGLEKGEKATFANPNRPNTAYEPFVEGVLTLIAVGLHLPRELLLKKFNASYSASKAALLDAWMHFRTERAWLVNSFCQPTLETWMAEAVASGRLSAPGFFQSPLLRWAYTRAAWHGDSQGSINPKEEVAAYRDAIDGNLMTHERAEWELFGSDWTRTFPTKRRERQMLKDADMLPAPKPGAAAPQSTAPAPAPRNAESLSHE